MKDFLFMMRVLLIRQWRMIRNWQADYETLDYCECCKGCDCCSGFTVRESLKMELFDEY